LLAIKGSEVIDIIERYICKDWRPEQVVGWLEKEGIIKLHPETVYQHIPVIATVYRTGQTLMNGQMSLIHASE